MGAVFVINTIVDVIKHSAAWRAGMRRGETLVSINAERIIDVIDYQYFAAMQDLVVETHDARGRRHRYEIHKQVWENLGLIFEDALMDTVRCCANHCIFCFIAQMPPHMRESLYVRDDDWRMSLMMGNYITLTNVSDREFDRILARRVSPLYISVHATDPAIRCKMMQNSNAGNILPRLKQLADNGTRFHCQIVLCPGYNDAEVLEHTLEDLYALQPYAASVAVVPVGLTKYRESLTSIAPVTCACANAVIDITERVARHAQAEFGTNFVYASDEMYMLANRELPPYAYYGDFDQIENGVGICAQLQQEYCDARAFYGVQQLREPVCIATGVSAHAFLRQLIDDPAVKIIPVRNDFFGPSITVAGLITGEDLTRQLKGIPSGTRVLIPATMLRSQGDLFLDDVTPQQVEQAAGIKLIPVRVDGTALYRSIYQITEQEEAE